MASGFFRLLVSPEEAQTLSRVAPLQQDRFSGSGRKRARCRGQTCPAGDVRRERSPTKRQLDRSLESM
jgi:hypothetical protein